MFLIPVSFFLTLTLTTQSFLYAAATVAWLYLMLCYNPRIN